MTRADTVHTVPVDDDTFLLMDEACKATRSLIAGNPIQRDLWDGLITARAWPFVTVLYSGIEQALKMLLLTPSDSSFTIEKLKKRPYGHNLTKLHAVLPAEDREHIELHFREHWSLFEFAQFNLGFDDAEGFISHINGSDDESGHVSWRYTLVDPAVQIPPTSLWTMWEIWEAICCRVRARRSKQGRTCLRLSQRLAAQMHDLIPVEAPYTDFSADLLQWWKRKNNSALAAWVELLVHASRGDIDQVEALSRLRPALSAMAERAIQLISRESAEPDEEQLLRRIQRADLELVWDPDSSEFGWADMACA